MTKKFTQVSPVVDIPSDAIEKKLGELVERLGLEILKPCFNMEDSLNRNVYVGKYLAFEEFKGWLREEVDMRITDIMKEEDL